MAVPGIVGNILRKVRAYVQDQRPHFSPDINNMTIVHFVEYDGTSHLVASTTENSLMRLAKDNGIPGIDADCGGECSCGTCHIILSQDWFDKLGALNEREEEMLSMNPERTITSRLACQIRVTENIDDIVVQLPEYQF